MAERTVRDIWKSPEKGEKSRVNMCSRLNQAMPEFRGGQSERGREERQRTVRMGQERGCQKVS